MVTTRIKLGLGAAVLAILAAWGFLWLQTSTTGYDQRYADCMRARGAFSYPSNAYDQASRECEKVAAP